MGLSPKLNLKTALQNHLIITQSLRQALEILQMPQVELGQWLREEIEKNPLLELEASSPPKNTISEFTSIPAQPSLHDHLLKQIREAFPLFEDQQMAEKILEELDERGFISETSQPLEMLLNASQNQVKTILEKLQTFDPPGIFAYNLKESLLLQLKAKNEISSISYQMIENHFQDLLQGKLKKIQKKIGELEFTKALERISHLNFRPAATFRQEKVPLIKADLSILKINNIWVIHTIEDDLPKFELHEDYLSLTSNSKEEKDVLRNWAHSAHSIFRFVKRRQQLLVQIGNFLVRKQKNFLDQTGELNPLTVQELADHLQLHESTVSRALADKYVMTPRGFLPLRSLFCSSPLTQTAKQLLQKLIATEDKTHPMTDEQLMNELKNIGLKLSRRTVVKYRHQLKIHTASRRKYTP